MLSFIAINPEQKTVEVVQAEDLRDVYQSVGLDRLGVDHGVIARLPNDELIAIVVGEHGMFKDPAEASYFSIGPMLYEGGAVIYAADATGDTVSIKHKPPVCFYRDAAEVEKAIVAGEVVRPEMAVNGQVTWSWPSKQKTGD
jgi:hypothetical protein